jgi:hypothetical protein
MNHRSLRQIIEQVDGKGDEEKAMERGSPESNLMGTDAGRRRRLSSWRGAGGESDPTRSKHWRGGKDVRRLVK